MPTPRHSRSSSPATTGRGLDRLRRCRGRDRQFRRRASRPPGGDRAAIERARATHRPAAALTFEPHPRSFFQPDAPLVPADVGGRQAAASRRDRPRRRDRADVRRGAGRAHRRALRLRHPGRPAGDQRRGDRLQLPLRQGAPRLARFPGGAGRAPRLRGRRRAAVPATTAAACPPARSATRWRRATSPRRPSCWAIPGSSPPRWCMATSAAASSAIRPPICGSARTAGSSTASMRCGSASAASATTASRTSAAGRCSTPARCCSKCFLFDFYGDLYGAALDVAFIAWIRPELNFASVEELIRRMDEDCPPGARRAGPRAGRVPGLGTFPARLS